MRRTSVCSALRILSVGLMLAPAMLCAQTAPAAPAAPVPKPVVDHMPVFEVVSVKENKSGTNSMRISSHDGSLTIENGPLLPLIRQAYSLFNSNDDLITGLPGWAKTERFDIQAKVSAEDAATIKDLTREQRGLMLLALLQDRFGLKAHVEQKEVPIYALVVAKSGLKIVVAKAGDTYANGLKGPNGPRGAGSMNSSRGHLQGQGVSLESLANFLTQQLDRPVLNRTSLPGDYDYTLDWSPEQPAMLNGAVDTNPVANAAPGLFTAVQEQLGLKLESTRGKVPSVVIEHIAEPTAN